MKKIVSIALGSVLALSLTAAAFADTPAPAKLLKPMDAFGRVTPYAPLVSFGTEDESSLWATAYNTVDILVPQWSLGPMDSGAINGGLRVTEVSAPKSIHFSVLKAGAGGGSDRVTLLVAADAGTPRGTYPAQVTLENAKFGERGTVQVTVLVQ